MIKVYDVSAIIYAGALSSYSKDWNVNYFPTGGLFKLFGYLLKDMKDMGYLNFDNPIAENKNKIVLCFDSLVNFRKQVIPEYKANRANNKTRVDSLKVSAQIQAAEYICKYLGIPMLKKDGYEADDMIYSLAKKYNNEHFTVRGDDSDLQSIRLYNKNSYIVSVAGRGEIYMDENTLGYKLAYGDTSDNIPAAPKVYQNQIVSAFKKNPFYFINYNIDNINNEENEIMKSIWKQLFLIMPKFVNIDDIEMGHFDKQKFLDVMNSLAFKKYLKQYMKAEREYGLPGEMTVTIELLNLLEPELKDYFLQLEEKKNESKKAYADNKEKLEWNKKISSMTENEVDYLKDIANKFS